MSFAFPSKQHAEAEATRMTKAVADPSCRRFVAELCPDAGRVSYGVRQEIKFRDRPDLGWVNRGFVWQVEGIMKRR